MRLLRPLLSLALVSALPHFAMGQEFVPGRMVVRYKAERSLARDLRVGSIPLRGVRQLTPGTHVVGRGDAALTAQGTLDPVARFPADPNVLSADPDDPRRRPSAEVEPNDPMYKYQWGLGMVLASQAW